MICNEAESILKDFEEKLNFYLIKENYVKSNENDIVILLIILFSGTFEITIKTIVNEYLNKNIKEPKALEILLKNHIHKQPLNPKIENIRNFLLKIFEDKIINDFFNNEISPSLKTQLDPIIDIRNDIAHSGEKLSNFSKNISDIEKTYFSTKPLLEKLDSLILKNN